MTLGWIGVAATVTQIAATAAQAGMQIYTAKETLDLAEEQAELQAELARKKAGIETAILESQKKLVDIQAGGLERSQNITLALQEAEAELRKSQLERQRRAEELAYELEMQRMTTSGGSSAASGSTTVVREGVGTGTLVAGGLAIVLVAVIVMRRK